MRQLTEYELEQFDIAFKHIMGIALGYDKYKNHTDFSNIRIGFDQKTGDGEKVPSAYFPMASELARVMSKKYDGITPLNAIANVFTPHNKEKAIKWLIDYCIANRIQPSSFAIDGIVWTKKQVVRSQVPHVAMEYQVAS